MNIWQRHRFFIGNQSPSDSYWTVRTWFLRGLGLIYFNAFAIIFFQGDALWGHNGLLPIDTFVNMVLKHFGTPSNAFQNLPSLFYLNPEIEIKFLGIAGMVLAIPLIIGYANLILLALLWLLQLSFANSGQLFYSYGWETQLLELTFLSFFFVPLIRGNSTPPSRIVIWSMRWMLFRLMLGAGLIKLRGDPCWRELTCLIYHYETQPNPHPLSYIYHQMPAWFHNAGTIFNHFVELVVPLGYFGPKKIRRAAGVITVIFQLVLISSGNLAWLNWLTLLMCICCFDDEFLSWLGRNRPLNSLFTPPFSRAVFQTVVYLTFSVSLIYLSRAPVLNLIKDDQAMNTSYDSWHLVNSYGAFGSIGKERGQIVISATESKILDEKTIWKEYEFFCAPGDITKRPCLITPYHYHLDWQIWFSSMRPELQERWLLRLMVRLLENDVAIRKLFRSVPFERPTYIKMDLYKYQFAEMKDWPETWWKRERLQVYMPPLSLQSPAVLEYLRR